MRCERLKLQLKQSESALSYGTSLNKDLSGHVCIASLAGLAHLHVHLLPHGLALTQCHAFAYFGLYWLANGTSGAATQAQKLSKQLLHHHI